MELPHTATGLSQGKQKLHVQSPATLQGLPVFTTLRASEFRLLVVQPSSHDPGALLCSLRHVPLDKHLVPGYIALSYTWQETDEFSYTSIARPGASARVELGGCAVSDPAKLPWIVRAAYEYQYASQSAEQRAAGDAIFVFWIDALCIDQSNADERGEQVERMAEIYSYSSMVLIVLGEQLDYEHSSESLNLQSAMFFETLEERAQREEARMRRNVLILLKHPYWRRAWIMQEIVNAPAAIMSIGRSVTSLPELLYMVERILSSDDVNVIGLSNRRQTVMDAIEQVLAMNEFRCAVRPNLLYVLQKTRNAQCSDARDAVYAKLALAGDGVNVALRPDYTMGIDRLLCRLTSRYVLEQCTLYVVCLAEPSHKPIRAGLLTGLSPARVALYTPICWVLRHSQWGSRKPSWRKTRESSL